MGGDDQASTTAVMADAQLSNARVLKPFPGFEAVYQGKGGGVPIMFPGTLDPRAGQPGMAPNLIAGLKMPIGSRIILWVPVAVVVVNNTPTVVEYDYVMHWRLRNVADFRLARLPYHFPRQSPGAPDSGIGGGPRLVIPAANDVIIYEHAEPAPGPGIDGIARVVRQAYRIGDGGGLIQPFVPGGGVGIVQQGVLDPATSGTAVAGGPIFQPILMDCLGDEVLISVRRSNPAANWDFTNPATDLAFSNIYGTGNNAHPSYPDLGIYMMQGTNPSGGGTPRKPTP